MSFVRPLLTTFVMGIAALPLVAGAQQVFRSVGPDGRVTFSDKPPPVQPAGKGGAVTAGGAAAAPASLGNLPFELREVAGKYPVTLYTGPNCAPCGAGRALLSQRGIPFSERTVTSNEDIEALQRVAADTSLPFLTIGAQQIKGFSDLEWMQFLDAAGYPRKSVLPASYRPAPATPLVAVQRPNGTLPAVAGQPAAAEESQPTVINRRPGTTGQAASGQAAGEAPAAPPANPAGIRF